MLPAYAGMILTQKGKGMAAFSAPRVCGDDPKLTATVEQLRGVLPAYAGMIRLARVCEAPRGGAPRVCGDDPKSLRDDLRHARCSPRMRG